MDPGGHSAGVCGRRLGLAQMTTTRAIIPHSGKADGSFPGCRLGGVPAARQCWIAITSGQLAEGQQNMVDLQPSLTVAKIDCSRMPAAFHPMSWPDRHDHDSGLITVVASVPVLPFQLYAAMAPWRMGGS